MDLAKDHFAGSGPVSKNTLCASDVPIWTVALAALLVLLPLDQCLGFDIWQAPSGQPEQVKSKVDYDARLTDRFFEVDQWSCPFKSMHGAVCRDGKPVVIHKVRDPTPTDISESDDWSCPDGCKECAVCRDGKPVVKNTARCSSTSFNVKHDVSYCEARLVDEHVIELLIHKVSPAFDDQLRIRIKDGEFSSQFWVLRSFDACTWTTTRQRLALDKKMYAKGDVIKGRIDFECLSEFKQKLAEKFGRRARSIKVHGVFKTILQ